MSYNNPSSRYTFALLADASVYLFDGLTGMSMKADKPEYECLLVLFEELRSNEKSTIII